MSYKEKFIEIYNAKIKRQGAKELLAWLEKTDFFTAPESTKYHGSIEEGLVMHSLNVYEMFHEEVLNRAKRYSGVDTLDDAEEEKVAICALLHDLCKVNFYQKSYRNQKDNDGNWHKVAYYTIDNQFAYGHGEKSVWLIQRFLRLTTEESIIIRWHMGGFDDSVKGGSYDLSGAWTKYPLGMLLHTADLKATYLMD